LCRVPGAVLCALCLVLAAHPAAQQPTTPFVRTSLDPAGEVTVGRKVELALEVYVPTWFTGPPTLPPLDIDGAFAEPLSSTTHVIDTVSGETWSGVRYTYAITPQTAGTIQVPSIALTFTYAIDAKPSPPFTVTTKALTFTAHMPPGAESLDYFFSTTTLHLSERYDPHRPATLSAGDAFTRVVTMSADDANGLMLPPVELTAPDGVRVTVDPPALSTSRGERGAAAVTTRTAHATYIADKPGRYTLPEVDVPYWSTSANAIRTAKLPEVTFEVAATPSFSEEIALPPEPAVPAPPPPAHPWAAFARRWWRVIVVGAALVWVAWRLSRRFGPPLAAAIAARRARHAESESRYFGLAQRASRSGDLSRTHAAVMAWLVRFDALERPRTVAALGATAGMDDLITLSDQVNTALFGPDRSAGASRLAHDYAAALGRARTAVLERDRMVGRPGALSPLNPS
jgi:hypothetical protein